jgi:hypothetical protein
LVELLVAMALIVFIMAILAEAFEAGIGTFRRLKAVSDMNERLRSASSILRRYLAADHFEGKKRLSDSHFWDNGPPKEGFFRIYQGNPYKTDEGPDSDGNRSYLSVDHILHFAVKLRGNNRDDYFQTNWLPANSALAKLGHGDSRFQDLTAAGVWTSYGSPWAEVAFFLEPTGETTRDPQAATASNLDLYTLYMRQRLAVPNPDAASSKVAFTAYYNGTGNYAEISFGADPGDRAHFYINSPEELTMPHRRLGALQVTGGVPGTPNLFSANYPTLAEEPLGRHPTGDGPLRGYDVLLTDVVSMDVRVMLGNSDQFVTLQDAGYPARNPRNPNCVDANNPNATVFDTWSSGQDLFYDYSKWATAGTAQSIPFYTDSNGNPLRIQAIRITLRIWDRNTLQTRQTSIIQDL